MGIIHNQDGAGNSKRSWVDGIRTVDGVRGPRLEWVGVVAFLFLLAAALLVLCALVRLAVVWFQQQLLDYWEWCEAKDARGETNRLIMPAARAIANDEFFTVPEDMQIGYASPPRNGVVEDEDLERGRPLRRFWHYPRPGLASSSIADANNNGKPSRIPGRDISDEGDADAARAGTERRWGRFPSLGASSSSQLQQQGTSTSIRMDDVRTPSGKPITLENKDEQVPRELGRPRSRRHLRSKLTQLEETSSRMREGEPLRPLGTVHGRNWMGDHHASGSDLDNPTPEDSLLFFSVYP